MFDLFNVEWTLIHIKIFLLLLLYVIVPQLEDMTQDDDMGRCVCVFVFVLFVR